MKSDIKNVSSKIFWTCIFLGVVIRFMLMSLGHNFDFDSYCIVGELAAREKIFMPQHRAITTALYGLLFLGYSGKFLYVLPTVY